MCQPELARALVKFTRHMLLQGTGLAALLPEVWHIQCEVELQTTSTEATCQAGSLLGL
jgi:hypothetical protein